MSKTTRRQKGYKGFLDEKSYNRNNPWAYGNYNPDCLEPDYEYIAKCQRDCFFNDKFFRGAKNYFKANRRANTKTELARIKKQPYNEQHFVDPLNHDKGYWIYW